ncbi:MAG: preprotein translocase subunit SecE [Calditrichaeota bacterium]|nr:preprotein translocase subunit SecE [Candidatus Cloacimonadota bacterium]MCA9786178.1 preprotein translocase subunit SecE [Candidatus Cloacimonadota bacterium]MCB1048067.1 preprotein translocase subunit SecE [Calditrichota bacterium]MCB9472424.1 preprotein translocase subunit SecE [Candidatus Delongbacteria bacterium]
MSKVTAYIQEVSDEMRKVHWPSWEELKESTAVVLFVTFILAFTIYAFDWVMSKAIGLLL